jgi:hypothetical protein
MTLSQPIELVLSIDPIVVFDQVVDLSPQLRALRTLSIESVTIERRLSLVTWSTVAVEATRAFALTVPAHETAHMAQTNSPVITLARVRRATPARRGGHG